MKSDAVARLSPRPGLMFAPVRHHSPRCAHHLRELIADFAPQRILIEGPDDLNALLPLLQHRQTSPPVAAYLHAVAGEDALRCRAYVPLAAFSPEWVALREAARLRIPASFIDLPFATRVADADNSAYFARAPEPTLADEPRPGVIASLLASSDCQDFDAWWERHFESGLDAPGARDYFASLLAFGALLREGDQDPQPDNEAREAHMAARIGAALAHGERCLVVCGAYHVAGIEAMLDSPAAQVPTAAQQVGAHLIAYPLARFERSQRYGAGMPAPGFYQRVWHAWQAGEPAPYQEPFAALAIELARDLRENGIPASLPDAMEAVSMAHRLAGMRGCRPGLAELRESLRSTMVKDGSDEAAFGATLASLLAQGPDGVLPPKMPVAPLLAETIAFCLRHRMPSRFGESKKKDLDIYRSERHRAVSQFLHQLRFLEVPYGERLAGPDFVNATDLGRVREIWTLRWITETATSLTENSRYGASLADAAVNKLLERLALPSGSPADLVLQVLVMGLDKVADRVLDAVERWLGDSYDALALAQGTARLALAFEARLTLGGVGMARLLPLLERAFSQTCIRLPWLGTTDAARSQAMLAALDDMHGMIRRQAQWTDAALFYGACATLHEADVAAQVRGGAAAILTVSGTWSPSQTSAALTGTFALAHMAPQSIADYMQGFLRIARSSMLASPQHLDQLSAVLAAWSEDDFLSALPSMRLAFSQFSRRETDELARVLAGPAQAPSLAGERIPDMDTLHQSRLCLEQVAGIMQRWGVGP
ncbi:hypothetical protein HF313_17430 [Massilia atriviolacea]|uniref:4-aminobutyrate aminotransferase n=1 Tax=Massilia atriviolacea TaxID=2495579 RepID=A0A430HTN1_9BURK|nr:DUF5682 family protein [Massilia atriviolacea]RSZ60928.1 hypothetical protein EJB06_01975 [Massilia atriviolacea]